MKKFLTVLLLIIIGYCAPAAAFDYGRQRGVLGFPGDYLTNFSANARALGMGGAYVGLSNDASGPYWNPAGFADMQWKEISFLYCPLYMDAGYTFIGYAHPLSAGKVLGTSIAGLWCNDLEKMSPLGESRGSFSDMQMTYFISYAQTINEKVNLGLNFKIVHQKIDVYSDLGYGLDVGLTYKPLNFLSVGANLQNVILQPQLRLKDEIDVFPVNLKTGFAINLFDKKLFWVGDINIINWWPDKEKFAGVEVVTPVNWHTGLEYNILDCLQVRGGINYKEITCGIGVLLRTFDFQYATSFHHLGITHRVSVVAKFGLIPTAREKLIIEKENALKEKEEKLENVLAEKGEELKIEEIYQDAFECYNKGKFRDASVLIEKIFASQPGHKKTIELRKKIEQEKSREKAVICLERAIECLRKDKTEEAVQYIKEAQMLDPGCKDKFEEEQLRKAKDYLSLKKYKDAEEILSKILILNPENEKAKEMLRRLMGMKEFID